MSISICVPRRVLIVDDDHFFGHFLCKLVGMYTSFAVEFVESIEDAEKIVSNKKVDVVMLDSDMADKDGIFDKSEVVLMLNKLESKNNYNRRNMKKFVKSDLMRNQLMYMDMLSSEDLSGV